MELVSITHQGWRRRPGLTASRYRSRQRWPAARPASVAALAPGDLTELAGYGVRFDRSTPLWYYVLKEAEVMAGVLHLGPVGGRSVAEVSVGLLQTDPASYVTVEPGWTPTLPSRFRAGRFRMTDFLTYGGVDPASRGQ